MTKPKTLNDYLIKDRAKGKFFVAAFPNAKGKFIRRVYQVKNLYGGDLEIKYIENREIVTSLKKSNYTDTEATPEQIKRFRAKESKLVEKIA